jgi:hypothetical protein
MKKVLITLYILALSGCSKEEAPKDPVDSLPPITQTGENTFACLINGKPFFSSYRRRAIYSGTSMTISGSRRDDIGLRSVSLQAFDVELIGEGTYLLQSKKGGNFTGIYLVDGGLTIDTSTKDDFPGILIITRLDLDEFIISGTFKFTVEDDSGNLYEITDGRFDLKF